MDPVPLFVILGCILLSAFFSGIEIAFLSSNKLKIELETKQGSFNSRILSFFIRKPSRFISSMVLGNNIVLVIYGIFIAAVLEPFIANYLWNHPLFVLFIQTIISTIIILITGEFFPKAIFRINPNGILKFFAIPSFMIYFLLWPFMIIISGISDLFIRLFAGGSGDSDTLSLGRIDLDNFVKETMDAANGHEEIDHEIKIFQNALDFSKLKARDCMIPRTDIIGIEVNQTIEELHSLFIDTQLSKILVYEENIDQAIGYVHSYELFKQPSDIRSVLLPVSFVPETMPAQDILEEFTRQRRTIAIVVDEFGGTSGLVTMEDIIEEIFGDIDDEHDVEEETEIRLSEDEFLFSGRLEIEELNEKYGFGLPESEDYETLAGYIIHEMEDIPDINTVVELGDFEITLTAVSGNRIEQVKMRRKGRD